MSCISSLVHLINHLIEQAAFQMQGGVGGQGLEGVDDFLFGPLLSADGADEVSECAMGSFVSIVSIETPLNVLPHKRLGHPC